MSFIQDCIRALCISVLAVPVFALASVAEASDPGTQQSRQASADEVIAPPAERSAGQSASSVFFEPTIPAAPGSRPAPLNAAFFEQLFGYGWSADAAVYELHLAGSGELVQMLPHTVLGTNALGDPFLLTVRSMLEVDLGQLSRDEQEAVSRAFVDRVWAVYGDFETEIDMVNTSALLFQGTDGDGSIAWRVIPGFCGNGGDAPLTCGSSTETAEIVFEESDQQDDEPPAIIAAALFAAAAAILACTANALGCQDNATNEFRFCEDQCKSGDQDCLDCCYDRYLIAWDNCFPCGRDRADQSDFSMCYDDDG